MFSNALSKQRPEGVTSLKTSTALDGRFFATSPSLLPYLGSRSKPQCSSTVTLFPQRLSSWLLLRQIKTSFLTVYNYKSLLAAGQTCFFLPCSHRSPYVTNNSLHNPFLFPSPFQFACKHSHSPPSVLSYIWYSTLQCWVPSSPSHSLKGRVQIESPYKGGWRWE